MKFTKGSVLNMTPARGTVTFASRTAIRERWTAPLLGFAVVVTWVRGDDRYAGDMGVGDAMTGLTPVVLLGGVHPVMVDDYVSSSIDYVESVHVDE